jgi:hypothetical protein
MGLLTLNACRLVKERNPGGGVQEGEVGMKSQIPIKARRGDVQFTGNILETFLSL